MTIISKAAASTSGESDSKSETNYQTNEVVSGPPPSYAQASGSSSTGIEPVFPRPTNHMYLNRSYGSIKDAWAVDTDLKIPEALLPPIELLRGLHTRPNLGLYTAYGAVKASILLVSSSSKRAFIKADTQYGPVTIQVYRPGSKQPYKLAATTKFGNMAVGLPRDYVGLLRYKTLYGKIKFSPELRTNVLEMSNATGFVGRINESDFVEYKTWEGDETDFDTKYGDICFMYVDELEALGPSFQEKMEGTVANVLGWFGLKG